LIAGLTAQALHDEQMVVLVPLLGEVHAAQLAAAPPGLTLVHFPAQRKHILWDTLGA